MSTLRRFFSQALLMLLVLAAGVPHLAHAAALKDLTAQIVRIVDVGIIPLLYALAFVYFLIGMVRFFFSEGDENRTKGKQFMLFSIIGLAVLFSVWGVVKLLLSVFSY